MTCEEEWDGCAEIRYHPDEEEAQSHFCHRDDAVAIGALLGALYDLAEEILPEPDFRKAATDGR